MIYNSNFREKILIDPILEGADSLKIVTGYASSLMASWHISQIIHDKLSPIDITVLVGMCRYDGLNKENHEGFVELSNNTNILQSKLTCQYVVEGSPVHSKIYIWEQNSIPIKAFMGSANYSQVAFSKDRREILQECDANEALEYFNMIEPDTIYCTNSEVEDVLKIYESSSIERQTETSFVTVTGTGIEKAYLSFITKEGVTGPRSGLNWGQRPGREPNQAYIPLPSRIAKTGFFPLDGEHFSVVTDDGVSLILRVEQQNNKAITTPLNNSLLGEYFRKRLGLANGAYVKKEHLEAYGRTDVTFYKVDDEQYVMDFSV